MCASHQRSGYLLTESTRQWEAELLSQSPPGALMQRAAAAVADVAGAVLRTLPNRPIVTGLIGPGNNGADALIALALLHHRGYRTRTFVLTDVPKAATDAWANLAGDRCTLDEIILASAVGENPEVIIDGLFGIGMNRPLSGDGARIAQWTHRARNPVIAVDCPTGLNPDTGALIGGARAAAVRATHTVTMLTDKPGLHTGVGPDYAGAVVIAPLTNRLAPRDGVCVNRAWVSNRLLPRQRTSHKGSFGTVAAIGGAASMPGAVLLAGLGAGAVGAGKVATITPADPVFDATHPQLMSWPLEHPADLGKYLSGLSAAVIGCGLGTDSRAQSLLMQSLATQLGLVVDADALNLIGPLEIASPLAQLLTTRSQHATTVLTPHPLEAARLLNLTTPQVQADRISAAIALATQSNATVLLKGAGTVLAAPNGRWGLVNVGGPALATGGTGDILAGMVAGLLAQKSLAWEAAAVAAWVHGDASDRWSMVNPLDRGLHSSELLRQIVISINHCHD